MPIRDDKRDEFMNLKNGILPASNSPDYTYLPRSALFQENADFCFQLFSDIERVMATLDFAIQDKMPATQAIQYVFHYKENAIRQQAAAETGATPHTLFKVEDAIALYKITLAQSLITHWDGASCETQDFLIRAILPGIQQNTDAMTAAVAVVRGQAPTIWRKPDAP